MKIEEGCLQSLVHLDEDIEGTPLKRGFIGFCTADLPEDNVFAVWFRKEDVGNPPWWRFESVAKEYFTIVDETKGLEQFE